MEQTVLIHKDIDRYSLHYAIPKAAFIPITIKNGRYFIHSYQFYTCRELVSCDIGCFLTNGTLSRGEVKMPNSTFTTGKTRLLHYADKPYLNYDKAIRVLNICEKIAGWHDRSTWCRAKFSMDFGDCAYYNTNPKIILWEGAREWLRSPQLFSLACLILRTDFLRVPIENGDRLEAIIKKFIEIPARERYYNYPGNTDRDHTRTENYRNDIVEYGRALEKVNSVKKDISVVRAILENSDVFKKHGKSLWNEAMRRCGRECGIGCLSNALSKKCLTIPTVYFIKELVSDFNERFQSRYGKGSPWEIDKHEVQKQQEYDSTPVLKTGLFW